MLFSNGGTAAAKVPKLFARVCTKHSEHLSLSRGIAVLSAVNQSAVNQTTRTMNRAGAADVNQPKTLLSALLQSCK